MKNIYLCVKLFEFHSKMVTVLDFVFYLVTFSSVVNTIISQHVMTMNSGVYCNEHILKQFASASPRHRQCSVTCAAKKMCVAFSHHEGQCFLHSRFCDVNSLPSAEGSSYSGKCLSVCI